MTYLVLSGLEFCQNPHFDYNKLKGQCNVAIVGGKNPPPLPCSMLVFAKDEYYKAHFSTLLG
jgi:hypothetical protein